MPEKIREIADHPCEEKCQRQEHKGYPACQETECDYDVILGMEQAIFISGRHYLVADAVLAVEDRILEIKRSYETMTPDAPTPETDALESASPFRNYVHASDARTLERRLTALAASREAEARDAARYRWLRSNALSQYVVKVSSGDTPSLYSENDVIICASDWSQMDAAIDAALAASAAKDAP